MHVGTHGSCVRSNYHAFESPFTLERTHSPCVPTRNPGHIDLQPHPYCAVISPILRRCSSHFVHQYGPYCLACPDIQICPSLIPLPPSEITCEPINVFFYPALCKDTKFCKRLQVLSNLFCKPADQQRTLRPKNKPATATEIKNHLEKK